MLSEDAPAAEGAVEDNFEAIEMAVMESRRGRWFLDEYVKRRSGGETKTLLTAIGKLENAVAANQDAITQRLSKALGLMTSLEARLSSTPGESAPPVQLTPQHMKFFKQDEELFEAPATPVAAVAKIACSENESLIPPIPVTEIPPKNRIVIIRHKTEETLDVPLHDEFRASA